MAKTAFLSRRGFTRLFGFGIASGLLRPILGVTGEMQPLITTKRVQEAVGVVRLSSNENPYGPSPAALEAMRQGFALAWRYPDEAADALVGEIAKLHAVGADHILLGGGSSEILKLCAEAFTGPGKLAVMAEPSFEVVAHYARTTGAKPFKVALTSDYRHNLELMLPDRAGLVYLCNPNNPTATVTPKSDVRAFLARVPAETIVVVDEAYAHYAESSNYESVISQVSIYNNLIVARTFSKIYGLAGLRCGYAVAHPEIIARLRAQQSRDSLNIMALLAAQASVGDLGHLELSRQLNRDTKLFILSALNSLGYQALHSDTNFLMVDLRRDVGPVIEALSRCGVDVGRRCPSLPSFLQVSIGTRPQMETFLLALRMALA